MNETLATGLSYSAARREASFAARLFGEATIVNLATKEVIRWTN